MTKAKADNIRLTQLNPAVESGDLELVKNIIEENRAINLDPNALTIVKAIISGNIELLKYFESAFSISPLFLSPEQTNTAIEGIKSQDMFSHLLTKYRGMRFGLNQQTTEIVAKSGNVENLRLLLSVRIPCANSDTLFWAVRGGSMDCVRFLVEDYKIDGQTVITNFDEALELAEKIEKFSVIAVYLREQKALLSAGKLDPSSSATSSNQSSALITPTHASASIATPTFFKSAVTQNTNHDMKPENDIDLDETDMAITIKGDSAKVKFRFGSIIKLEPKSTEPMTWKLSFSNKALGELPRNGIISNPELADNMMEALKQRELGTVAELLNNAGGRVFRKIAKHIKEEIDSIQYYHNHFTSP
ncbi:Ankyrin repeats (3 copies) [Legionella geestiana]|uniref:Ankyrin repeats (3 copies) n=1 Tax=Legionella geestiana TaxID=45065 RepID=A0A0W0U9C4_9GAMM|nr:ankyrin repeat domain-containing protein [Legionella geestiana]KTD04411.1 Ankyrin repeats (3 copies) [Legionella geestiana]QBS12938.1 hypothetical protein E4T54_09400 [Legionella geestiana]QDQ39381.1 ankyrin repeat domain-containing protein [Legionella geestiana]STX54563.1 Ankyrin repeats (3 copies) [Legionella geestiana]